MDCRRQIKNDIHGIGESLLVFWVLWAGRIEGAAVVSGLNFARDFGAVRVSAMKEKCLSPDPAGIEVGKISARVAVCGRISNLMRHEHALHVEPSAGRAD